MATELADCFKDINQDNLEKATALLAQWGFSVPEALDMVFAQIAEDQFFPYAEIPNETTLAALEQSARGEGVYTAKDPEDIFRHLGLDEC